MYFEKSYQTIFGGYRHKQANHQFVLTDKANGGELYKHLPHQGKIYRKRCGSAHNRSGIPNRVDIDERPVEANNRERIGDWEADTIIGKNHKGAILSLLMTENRNFALQRHYQAKKRNTLKRQ